LNLEKYKILKTDSELFAASLMQTKVSVVVAKGENILEIVDYGGQIEKFTPVSVKVNGGYYFRDSFEFRAGGV
jgi:hypothetical protein